MAAHSTVDLERIAGELEGAETIEIDLSIPGAGAELAELAAAALGGVDILVNNAGVSEQPGNDATVMQINYIAPAETTNALIKQMAERGHGSVIHMSSIADQTGIAESPTYSASKAAIDALCRTQATAFGPRGVRVNAVAPGLIITDMLEGGRQVPRTRRRAGAPYCARPLGRARGDRVGCCLLGLRRHPIHHRPNFHARSQWPMGPRKAQGATISLRTPSFTS